MTQLFVRLATVLLAVLLGACNHSSAPDAAPANVTVTAGDSYVTVSWDAQAGQTYWIFHAAAASITRDNYLQYPQAGIIVNATSPQVVSGLVNGTQYAFMVNATNNGSAAGPTSGSLSATPRLAGVNWTVGNALGTADLHGIAYGYAKYVAVGAGGTIYNSTDGATWTVATASNTTNDLNAVATGATLMVAVGASGTVLTTTDTATWTAVTASSSVIGTTNLNGVAYGGTFIAVGAGGKIFTSGDASTWVDHSLTSSTADLYWVGYVNGRYVALGAGGAMWVSLDSGATWTSPSTALASDLYSMTYGAGLYVLSGAGGLIATSTDLASWTTQTTNTTQALRRVTYSSQFVVVGAGGTILYGTDGITWSAATSNTSNDLYNVMRGGTLDYVAVGAAGTNLLSR